MKRVSALLLTCTLGLSALVEAHDHREIARLLRLCRPAASLCPAGDDLRRGDDAL